MALNFADRVYETSTTTGTGTLNLAGAANGGYQTFALGVGDGNTCYYCIVNSSADEWEVGLGTVTDSTPDTLSRDTVYDSSNNGNLVNFSSGTKQVFQVDPAIFLQYLRDNYPNWDTAYGWGDHATEGYLKNIVEDTTPQLGGNLDPNGKFIAGDVTPSADFTYDLGSSSARWSEIWGETYHSKHAGSGYSNFAWYNNTSLSTNMIDDHQFGSDYFAIQKKNAGNTVGSITMHGDGSTSIVGYDDVVVSGGFTYAMGLSDTAVSILQGYWDHTVIGSIRVLTGDDTVNMDDGKLAFYTTPSSGSESIRLLIDPDGHSIFGASSDALGASAGSVTVSTGDSGSTTIAGDADDLIVESNGNAGISILTPDTNTGSLRFGDTGGGSRGILLYDHNTDVMSFLVETVQQVSINNTNIIFGDGSSDALGASTGSVTISTGDSGASALIPVSADELVIENDGNAGIVILTPNTANASLRFGDPQGGSQCQLKYDHSTDSFVIVSNAGDRLFIDSSGLIQVGSNTSNYETLISGDDDIPNRKYVTDYTIPGVFTASGSDDITSTAATVSFDTEVLDPSSQYSISSGEITVTAAGYYEISYSVMITIDDDTGDVRSEGECWIERDSGSGFAAIAQSYGSNYLRELTGGGGGTSITATFICQLTAGDEIRLRAVQTYATVNCSTVAGRPQLSIKRISQ